MSSKSKPLSVSDLFWNELGQVSLTSAYAEAKEVGTHKSLLLQKLKTVAATHFETYSDVEVRSAVTDIRSLMDLKWSDFLAKLSRVAKRLSKAKR